jgi:hypothetical protein
MTDANTQETIRALMARRNQHAKQLEGNPDFKAIQALDQAIAALGGRPTTFNGSDPSRLTQPSAARRVILERGVPVPTKELLQGVQKLGVHVGGKNPAGNFVSVLSANDDFVSVDWGDGKAWWVADRPLPQE